MKRITLSTAAALALSGAAMMASTSAANAQTQSVAGASQTQANPSNTYEGVSQPPSDDVISATEMTPTAPATPAATAPNAAVPAAAPAAPSTSKPSAIPQKPDYGIVDSAPAGVTAASTSGPTNGPRLQARPHYNPDAEIVMSVATPENEVPEGTPVRARLEQEISSRENGAGTPWSAQVSQEVLQDGRVIIPVGSVIHGRITHADYGRRMYGPASLRLTPEDVVLPDGTRYSLHARVSQTAKNSDTKMGREGLIESKDHVKRVAAEYAAGGGSGAVLGATVAGPAGAIAGSAIGVGFVTAHWLRTNHAAVLPANSEITFGLTQPLMLSPAQVSSTVHP